MKLEIGINKCSNADYHADKEYLSSSNYKLLLTDLPKFHKERILGIKEPDIDRPYFVEGSYVHTLILEPEMVEVEYAVYEGPRRQGKEWEAFKKANPTKQALTKVQQLKCMQYFSSYEKFKLNVNPIRNGISEQTICGVYQGIPTKVRFDYINIEGGYIVDVKTSGKPVDYANFSETVDQYNYDLSAALYLDLAEKHYGKRFEFYFMAISKREPDCQLYRLSEERRIEGQKSLQKAAEIYKYCLLNDKWDVNLEEQYTIQDI